MAAAGGGRWQDNMEPNARSAARQHMVSQLSELFKADPCVTPEKLYPYAARAEEDAFSAAQSQADYLRRIAMKLESLARDRRRALQAAAENRKQQMQMAHQMQLGNSVQTVHGGNSLLTTTPQAASAMSSLMRPPSQQPNWHMPGPNMQFRPSNMMAMLNQNFNSQSAAFAPVAHGIPSAQQVVQSRPMQSQNKHQDMQFQQINFGNCDQASVAQLQGQPVTRPNAQPNYHLNQNASGIYVVQQQQPMHFIRNHQGLGVNQNHINSQWYQMSEADNVAELNTGYSGGLNSQQNVGCTSGKQSSFKECEQERLQKETSMESQLITPGNCGQVTINQQSNVHRPNPQIPEMTNHDEAVDWREEMFQKIKSWKASYFSDIMEVNRILIIPEITEEELQSLPKSKAEAYKRNSNIKKIITCVLKFLQLQKSEIPETYRGKLPQYETAIQNVLCYHRQTKVHIKGSNLAQESKDCHVKPQTINITSDTAPFNGGKSSQQKHRADANISQGQTVVTTTPPSLQKTDIKDPQGVRSPCFSAKSLGVLQSSPTNDIGACFTPSPVAKSGVVQVGSPYSSLNSITQSALAKPRLVAAVSPCASVKSSLTSTIEKSQILATASPCSSVKSTLLSNAAKSGVAQVTSPCDSVKSTAPHDNNQVTPSQLIVPASLGSDPVQTAASQAEDEVCAIAKTPVAKKPIDRLLDAVRASSPSVLHSSLNSIKSALIAMDSVPLTPWSGSNNKMKRAYDVTSSYSESPPLVSLNISGATYVGEHSAKRQKTQDAKELLLDEIEATNSKLIDTTISILRGNLADGITSCNGGTLIKLLYTSVSLAPNLKSLSGMQPLVMPVTLLVPEDYPASSPTIICDERGETLRKNTINISEAVDVAFRHALRVLPEPRSLKETATAWDACVRRGVTEFVQQHAGGVLSSRFGQWESCIGA